MMVSSFREMKSKTQDPCPTLILFALGLQEISSLLLLEEVVIAIMHYTMTGVNYY